MPFSESQKTAASRFKTAFKEFREAVVASSKLVGGAVNEADLYDLVKTLDGVQMNNFSKGRGSATTFRTAVLAWKKLLTDGGGEHSSYWLALSTEPVREAREAMIAACEAALSLDYAETSTEHPIIEGGIGHNNPPAIGVHWREIFADDFAAPAEPKQREAAIQFLRGDDRQGWWTAIHVAVARDSWVERMVEAAETGPLVVLHSAAAEGKTTVVRQVAYRWLGKGRRVFHLLDDSALHDPAFQEAIDWNERPLLLVDRVGLTRSKPAWVSHDFVIGGCLLVCVQSRKVRDQRLRIGSSFAQIRLVPTDINDQLDRYVDQIVGLGAAANPDLSETRALFHDGLNRAAGGMFAAAWQATRGKALDQRFAEIVQDFLEDDANLIALAAIVFVNLLRENDSQLADLKRSRVLGLIDALDLTADAMDQAKEAVSKIGEMLDGEFSRDRIDYSRNPQMEVRHPSIAHGFWHHIFGRANPIIAEVVAKWPFYSALAMSYKTDTDEANAVITAILVAHSKAWVHDRKYGIFRPSMKEYSRLKTAKEIADLIPSTDWDATINLTIAATALDEVILGSKPLADRGIGKDRLSLVDGDRHASANHLITVAKLAQRHFPAEIDWRTTLNKAWVRASTTLAKRIVAHDALEICAEDADCTPQALTMWARRARLDDDVVQSDSYKMFDRLADRFSMKQMQRNFPDFAEGSHQVANLGSVRAIERHFWRLASSDNRMAKAIKSMLNTTPPPAALSQYVTCLLLRWYRRDRNSPQDWPDGVIDSLGKSLYSNDALSKFLDSYNDYFYDLSAALRPEAGVGSE